jgi:arsenite methyltransferase
MNGLKFTDEAARQLVKVYQTKDVIAQRLETIRHLNLSPGEIVLDIGCGPGFLCESMGEIVGRDGAVVGIDISADLIAFCNRRKASTWVSYEVGDATKLNQSDASFDVVHKLPNISSILIVLCQRHFVSENPERMAAVMKSWERHCAHPRLPRLLAHRLVDAGFRLDGATVFSILNLQYDDDSYSKGLAQVIRGFVGSKEDVPADDLINWHNEFERLSEIGRYFFSSNRYIFKASKPVF